MHRWDDVPLDWAEAGSPSTGAIPFALDRNGNPRDVDEVPRGLACECTCPGCHGRVIARHGEIVVHHFAHEDRRECRHALEASIFGMTVKLLAEPRARLCLPPFGDREALADEVGATFTPKQEAKFFASPWVVDGEIIPMTGGVVHVSRIDDSTPDSPDLTLPDRQIEIHLISHKKTPQTLLERVRSAQGSVLGIDLRKYAARWWDVCDEDKDGTRRVVSQAIDLLRDWLASHAAGRGWLTHAEFGRRRQKLIDWVAEQRQREKQRRDEEERLRKPGNEQLQHGEADIPPQDPTNDDDDGLDEDGDETAGPFARFRNTWAPRYWQAQVQARPAAPLGFGRIGEDAPPKAPQEDCPDKIIRENVGICPVCQASQNEVVLGSGPFQGRKAICCSRHPRHPMTMIPPG